MEIRPTARAIVYDIRDGAPVFLILHKEAKDYWESPQGAINKGEKPIDAAIREAREESGLKNLIVEEDSRCGMCYFAESKGEELLVILTAYAIRANSNEKIELSEHNNARWVGYEDYKRLVKYKEQVWMLEAVCKRTNGFGTNTQKIAPNPSQLELALG